MLKIHAKEQQITLNLSHPIQKLAFWRTIAQLTENAEILSRPI
jgi:hypothetical protein